MLFLQDGKQSKMGVNTWEINDEQLFFRTHLGEDNSLTKVIIAYIIIINSLF
jgi:hypothetical protein